MPDIRFHPISTLLLGFALLGSGCGDGNDGGSFAGVPIENMLTAYAAAYCSWLYRCCPSEQLAHLANAPLAFTGNSEAECRTNYQALVTLVLPTMTASQAAGRLRYDPRAAKACFDGLKSSCWPPGACPPWVEPLVATGGACTQDGECHDRVCLGETSDTDGILWVAPVSGRGVRGGQRLQRRGLHGEQVHREGGDRSLLRGRRHMCLWLLRLPGQRVRDGSLFGSLFARFVATAVATSFPAWAPWAAPEGHLGHRPAEHQDPCLDLRACTDNRRPSRAGTRRCTGSRRPPYADTCPVQASPTMPGPRIPCMPGPMPGWLDHLVRCSGVKSAWICSLASMWMPHSFELMAFISPCLRSMAALSGLSTVQSACISFIFAARSLCRGSACLAAASWI